MYQGLDHYVEVRKYQHMKTSMLKPLKTATIANYVKMHEDKFVAVLSKELLAAKKAEEKAAKPKDELHWWTELDEFEQVLLQADLKYKFFNNLEQPCKDLPTGDATAFALGAFHHDATMNQIIEPMLQDIAVLPINNGDHEIYKCPKNKGEIRVRVAMKR